jgi:hypothetical protein
MYGSSLGIASTSSQSDGYLFAMHVHYLASIGPILRTLLELHQSNYHVDPATPWSSFLSFQSILCFVAILCDPLEVAHLQRWKQRDWWHCLCKIPCHESVLKWCSVWCFRKGVLLDLRRSGVLHGRPFVLLKRWMTEGSLWMVRKME